MTNNNESLASKQRNSNHIDTRDLSIEERKSLMKKKKTYEKSKKWKWYRFTNILTLITVAALLITGIVIYQQNFILKGVVWGNEKYSRVSDRPQLDSNALNKVNEKYKVNGTNPSANVTQVGPSLELVITVQSSTSHDDAKNITNNIITDLLTELKDSKTEANPLGATFQKYDLNIIIINPDMKDLTKEQQQKIAQDSGVDNKAAYPYFGNIKQGVLSWSNN